MAKLTLAQAIERIKTPKYAKELNKALRKKARHLLHSEADTDTDLLLGAKHDIFLTWVRSILGDGANYDRFKQLYRPPVYTNELVESIFSQFERVFDAQDRYEKFNFATDELESDAMDYRKQIGDLSFWQTQGMETLKVSVDSVLIVDLPKLPVDTAGNVLQDSEHPEPYYYVLDIDHVLDMENSRVKAIDTMEDRPFFYFKTEYIIFREEDKVHVFDDTFYRTFEYTPGEEPKLVSEVAHNLGYCPARSFWTTPLNSKSKILKKAPITNSISELDWLLFFELAAKYLKLYAPFPIYAIYKSTCNYVDTAAKMKCSDGWLVTDGMRQGETTGQRCPKCKNKIKVGPGNILELRAPQDKDDPDLLSNPLKIIPAEASSLDAVNEEIKTRREMIYDNCVGKGIDPINDQAQNELQVQAGFESRTNVLVMVKRNFEIAHSFVLDTVYRLRYGENYKGCTIEYGSQFFLKDEAAEIEEYKTAKEQGLPAYDLLLRRKNINDARYRNNPDMSERLRILQNLDPFPDMSGQEVLDAYKANGDLFDPIDVLIKVHFNRFVDKFEREQANLLPFASAKNFDVKIKIINDIIRGYAEEYAQGFEKKKETPAPPPIPGKPPIPGQPPEGEPAPDTPPLVEV